MSKENMKKTAALAALDLVETGSIVGVGTGSTVNYFINALNTIKHKIDGAVASSKYSASRLRALDIHVYDLNTVDELSIYVDGADEINQYMQMIKGGGGALTGEKIVASVAKKFVCIADESKKVEMLGAFSVAVEVIPAARSYVAREIVKIGGNPVYRKGFLSDYGNVLLDVHNLDMVEPIKLEEKLNNINGIVANGIFAKQIADVLLLGMKDGKVKKLTRKL